MTNTDFFAWVLLRARIRLLRDLGHEVSLITNVGRFEEKLLTLDVDLHHVPIAREIRPLADARAVVACHRIFRRTRPDVVNTYTSKAGLIGRVAARLAGVPFITHTMQGLPFYEGQSRSTYWLYATLEWVGARFGHALFSENLEDVVLAERRLASRRRIYHVGSGVLVDEIDAAVERADLRSVAGELEVNPFRPTILFPARLEPIKGHEFFLSVLARLREIEPSFVCFLAGEGELRAQLEATVYFHGLEDHVRFLGFRENVPALLSLVDIVVLPSRKEGIPRSLMEGMTTRKPVVATDVVGNRELVIHGETGLLSPFGEVEPMARNLARLIRDPELRRRLGEAGRERVVRHFDDREVVTRMSELYETLVS